MSKASQSKNASKTTSRTGFLHYPAELLAPIGKFLVDQIKRLEKRNQDIKQEDPFADTGRTINNAAPDSDAAEQFGHARTEAIEKEIRRKLAQTQKALARLKAGQYGICESCSQIIDTDRLSIYPEATLCVSCERKKETKP